jgi:RHS repeat-associated protein
VTGDDAGVVSTLDYYPYSAERISTGADATDRHYIGERFDDETDLSYLNARYFSGNRGQFLSEDPLFLNMNRSSRQSGLVNRMLRS